MQEPHNLSAAASAATGQVFLGYSTPHVASWVCYSLRQSYCAWLVGWLYSYSVVAAIYQSSHVRLAGPANSRSICPRTIPHFAPLLKCGQLFPVILPFAIYNAKISLVLSCCRSRDSTPCVFVFYLIECAKAPTPYQSPQCLSQHLGTSSNLVLLYRC
jgi:hypothetical protein